MPIDSVTLSDKRGPGERALTRRSARQSWSAGTKAIVTPNRVICARIRVADTPDRLQVMAMSESSKRARAAVGDRRRSAPHAGLAFAVNSDQVLRITVLAFAPVAGARAGGALWARAAGRAGGGACGLRSG